MNKTARQQYEETYRRLRAQKKAVSMTADELKGVQRVAAHKACKSMFALKHNADMIEHFQTKLATMKERSRIRQQNKIIMATKFNWTY